MPRASVVRGEEVESGREVLSSAAFLRKNCWVPYSQETTQVWVFSELSTR